MGSPIWIIWILNDVNHVHEYVKKLQSNTHAFNLRLLSRKRDFKYSLKTGQDHRDQNKLDTTLHIKTGYELSTVIFPDLGIDIFPSRFIARYKEPIEKNFKMKHLHPYFILLKISQTVISDYSNFVDDFNINRLFMLN